MFKTVGLLAFLSTQFGWLGSTLYSFFCLSISNDSIAVIVIVLLRDFTVVNLVLAKGASIDQNMKIQF